MTVRQTWALKRTIIMPRVQGLRGGCSADRRRTDGSSACWHRHTTACNAHGSLCGWPGKSHGRDGPSQT